MFLCFFVIYTLLSLSGNSGRLTWVRLQQQQERRYPVLQVHAGSFRVSRNPPVRDHYYACVYTLGLGTPTTSQHNIFDSEKTLTNVLVLLKGFRTTALWISSPTFYQLSLPVTPALVSETFQVKHRRSVSKQRESLVFTRKRKAPVGQAPDDRTAPSRCVGLRRCIP